jgi:hypothetical protein
MKYRIVPTYQYIKGTAFIFKLQKKTWLGWWDCEIVFSNSQSAKTYLEQLEMINGHRS